MKRLEFSPGGGVDVAGGVELLIALELDHGFFELVGFVVAFVTAVVAQVVQPLLDAGDNVDGVEMADADGVLFLAAVEFQHAAFWRWA